MRISLRERVAPVLALGLAAAFAPAIAEWGFAHTQVSITAQVHFYAVGMTALVTAASVALTLIGARLSDTRTVLIGTAFESGVLNKRREVSASLNAPSPTAAPVSV